MLCHRHERFALQWRRQHFFGGGGRPGHLKAITRPRRGSEGEGPPDGSEGSFLKTIQSIRKWIHFSIIATFSCPKKSIFLRRISKSWTYFTRISEFIRKSILKFSIFMISYKSREIPGEFSYQVEKPIKKAQKIA